MNIEEFKKLSPYEQQVILLLESIKFYAKNISEQGAE